MKHTCICGLSPGCGAGGIPTAAAPQSLPSHGWQAHSPATDAGIQACATCGGAEQGVAHAPGCSDPSPQVDTAMSHPHPPSRKARSNGLAGSPSGPAAGLRLPSFVATLVISPENKPDIDVHCLKPFQTFLLSKNSSPNKALAVWPCLPFWEHLPHYLTISRTGLQQASFRCASVTTRIFRVGALPLLILPLDIRCSLILHASSLAHAAITALWESTLTLCAEVLAAGSARLLLFLSLYFPDEGFLPRLPRKKLRPR